jgi:metal-responsive CopG/Arc/MetJ family transcriptional regulator
MAARPFTKTEQVITTINEDTLRALDGFAERQRISRAEAIRLFIIEGLAERTE